MKPDDWFELLLYFALLCAGAPLLGRYLAWLYQRPGALAAEKIIAGKAAGSPMNWKQYTKALLVFNGLGLIVLLGLQLAQSKLPANPQALPDVPFPLALNTAISFVTNTNWQSYSGEATLSYLTQMLGLGVQNFLSAATGMAVAVALARGLANRSSDSLGNFWSDTIRSTVYVLLPLSLILAVVLAMQGVPQSFSAYKEVTTLEGVTQTLPLGPAASQIAIKQLGTNGGGFFGVNSEHPFENPTPFSNFIQCLSILLVPAAFPFLFGRMVGSKRHGWCLFTAMMVLLVAGFALSLWSETRGNPALGVSQFLEGKETRIGIANSVLWSTTTTAASNGSVNAMHDSLSPLAGMIAMFNMMLGEVVFGGAGAGLYGIILFVVLTVFLAGLMVGRTPEYLGKRIESREVICAVVAVLAPCFVVLVGTALSCATAAGTASLTTNTGSHAFSEALYAWTSAANNNGSAFGGLNANTPFFNYGLGAAMLIGRFAVIIPVLLLAGRMSERKVAAPGPGTFPTDGGLFVVLLLGVIIIVGGLTYLPSLTLGPIVEHLLMQSGATF